MRSGLEDLIAQYRESLQSERRALLDHFALGDVAHKVVGVGSVGTWAWILLFEGQDESEAIVLQAKQANASVLTAYAGQSQHTNQGERVVAGQRLMQASSDIFLGWVRFTGRDGGTTDYYLRQLRDWKLSAEIEEMDAESLALYATLCGWTLAKAHARSGDRVALAAYLGGSDTFENAVTEFAQAYARCNEQDFRAFAAAAESGQVAATMGL